MHILTKRRAIYFRCPFERQAATVCRDHTSAYEQGFDLFKCSPDLLLAEVAWLGPKDKLDALEFLEGYKAARRQHDDYERERRT